MSNGRDVLRIDPPTLAELGNPTAAWAQQALSAQLAGVLASRIAPGEPGAPTLSVVVNSIYLGGGAPADPDIMTGVASLNGRQVQLKATSTWFPSPTDQALPEQARVGRNEPCPCGSGKKFKHCHGQVA